MPFYINAYDVDFPFPNESSTTVASPTSSAHYDSRDPGGNATKLSVDDVLYYTIEPVFIAGRYVHLLWYSIGFIGNVISAILWLQPNLYEVCPSAHYLFAIAICDIICQFLHVFYYLKIFWRVQAFDNTALCEFWSLVYMVPQYVGQLLVIGYTIDKLMTVHNPFSGGSFASQNRTSKIIVWIVITVTVMVFPQAYFWEGYCSAIRQTIYPIMNWLTLILIYILTPIATLILNFRILYIFRHPELLLMTGQQQKAFASHLCGKFRASLRESIMILVTLSFFRVISLLPDTFMRCLLTLDVFEVKELPPVYIIADIEGSERWQRYINFSAMRFSIGFISYSYLALSIVIYCLTSPTFRNDLRSKLKKNKMTVLNFSRAKYKRIRKFVESFRENDI